MGKRIPGALRLSGPEKVKIVTKQLCPATGIYRAFNDDVKIYQIDKFRPRCYVVWKKEDIGYSSLGEFQTLKQAKFASELDYRGE